MSFRTEMNVVNGARIVSTALMLRFDTSRWPTTGRFFNAKKNFFEGKYKKLWKRILGIQ